MSQKIIIPKGLINPNETTIIEIPEDVQDIETVVAKPVYTNDVYDSEEVFENEYSEGIEKSKFEYGDECYDEDDGHVAINKRRVVKTTQNYPIYKYHERHVYEDESSYTYSNTISKPVVNESSEEKEIYFPLKSNVAAKSNRKLKVKDVTSVLDILEKVELKRLYKNLRNYQCARRKLLFETANIHNFDDICASLYGLY